MRKILLPAAALLPYATLCLSFAGSLPMWDARIYASCVQSAARGGLFPFDYNCAGHPTAAWSLASSALLWMAPDSYWPMLLASVVLGAAGLWAFFDIVRLAFAESEIEAALLTACFGLFPVVVAGTVDLNPDHGVLVFFLLALRSLLRGRLLLASLFGALLVFSKEPGVLLYGLAIAVWALLLVARREGSVGEKLRRLGRAWPLLLPLAGFATSLLLRLRMSDEALWHLAGDRPLIETFTTFRLLDAGFIAQLIGIFVLQFAWVLTALAVVRWARMAGRFAFSLPAGEPPLHLFFDALLLLATLLLTRYQTFLNLRYYVAVFPLLLLCGFAGLRQLLPRGAARTAALGALLVLFAASTLRTIDPLSRAAMGTIRFGEHAMLDMTSRTGECCGHGRDQIGYNLEHLHLNELLDRFLADFHAHSNGQGLSSARLADFNLVSTLDVHTWQRTMSRQGAFRPRMFTVVDLARGRRPPRLLYLRFFYADNERDEARIRSWYDPAGEETYDSGGYQLTVVDYRLRETDEKFLAPRSDVR